MQKEIKAELEALIKDFKAHLNKIEELCHVESTPRRLVYKMATLTGKIECLDVELRVVADSIGKGYYES
jgi:hypothetical protein